MATLTTLAAHALESTVLRISGRTFLSYQSAAADEMSACRSPEDLPVMGTRTDLLVRFDASSWTLDVAHPIENQARQAST